MSLLDDDIIVDPIPSLITRYLIDHTKYINTKYIIGGSVIGVKKYYKCDKCDNKYVPTYKSVLFAAHVNRTRKMKCPKCGEKSWQRKILK